jgi:hypothetical protein
LRLSYIGEAMSAHRRGDEDVSRGRRQSEVVDLEAGLSGMNDEDLGVGVAVKQRPSARPVVDEEQRDWQPAVVGADEPVGLSRAGEVIEADAQ